VGLELNPVRRAARHSRGRPCSLGHVSDDMVFLFGDAPLAHEATQVAQRLVRARAEYMGEWDDYVPELKAAIQSFLGVSKDMDEIRHRSTYLVAALTNFALEGFGMAAAIAAAPEKMEIHHLMHMIEVGIETAEKRGDKI
jgi:hypothetical protein